MKFNEQWLREWVDPPVDRDTLAHQLTMAGLEVDAIEPVAAVFSDVIVGKVVAIEPHPQADRLQVCQVDIGAADNLTIVCGASNVHVGMMAPTACIGAQLPGGLTIKKSRLRGVESHGMLCSATELGLAEHAEGLLSLPLTLTPGENVRSALQLDDVSIELGLTPNRGDCLSIAGIAREVSVLNRCAVTAPAMAAVAAQIDDRVMIELEAEEACPRYIGRVVRGINPEAETPLWMQERLRRCGLRSISPVVDVTNYVLLELGQPMHAFDLNKLNGAVHVRYATAGETLTLLDGQQITLEAGSLVIADDETPLALAGIMGGLDSAVGSGTNDIFLESAHFSPAAIAGKARAYGLHTDSSHRFERGVDADLPRRAMERATALLLEIVGGQAGPLLEAVNESQLPARPTITLRAAQLERILGIAIAADEVGDILQRLGLQVDKLADGWQVIPPGFRFDLAIEADLIEEVIRIYGYETLPETSPRMVLKIESIGADEGVLERTQQTLIARGYQQAITYSFVAEEQQQALWPESRPVRLANPLSADLAVMRCSLWPGLLNAIRHNLNRQHESIRFFESGIKFLSQADDIKEVNVIAGAVCGTAVPEQWGQASRQVDFFDIKSDVEALLATSPGNVRHRFRAATHSALHPGQSARIEDATGRVIGWMGLLHPQQATALALERDVYLFEIEMAALAVDRVVRFRELSRFPAIRRDLALVVDESVAARDVEEAVVEVGGKLLQNIQLFDVYTGKGIDSGRKSLAMGLTLQDFSRTLTDDEVEGVIATILDHLRDKLGATLRE